MELVMPPSHRGFCLWASNGKSVTFMLEVILRNVLDDASAFTNTQHQLICFTYFSFLYIFMFRCIVQHMIRL